MVKVYEIDDISSINLFLNNKRNYFIMNNSESVVIDNLSYNIDDEELDNIDYYEILTMDELIKDNPTFLAFSREEISDELNHFFDNRNKADSLTDLFYKETTKNIHNYVFIADAEKKDHGCIFDDVMSYVNKMNNMSKLQYKVSQKDKNKYCFALSYDTDSKKLRLKPHMKTTIELKDTKDGTQFNIFYPVFSEDDTNIPIIAAYYKQPTSIVEDFLSKKVTSHLSNHHLLNYATSDAYSDIDKLLKAVKPKMKFIIENFPDDEENYALDHNYLNNILKSFDSSLEDINVEEFQVLKELLQPILDIKSVEHKYNKVKIETLKVSNSRLDFYKKLQTLRSILDISEKSKEDYSLLISTLQDEKISINAPPLLYNNINDIVKAVSDNVVEIEDIIANIEANRKVIVIDNALKVIKGMTQNNIDDITTMLNDLTIRFSKLKNVTSDLYKLNFIDFYKDIKEIKEANDYSAYDGIPDVYKNDQNFEGMGEKDDVDEINVDITKIQSISLEKYWLSTQYSNEKGFVELLQIMLPIVNKISDISKISISYDLLCNELYKYFAGIPTKYNILYEILKNQDISIPDGQIRDYVKIKPVVAIGDEDDSDEMVIYVKTCNKKFMEIFNKCLYTILGWWSLQIYDDYVKGNSMIEENEFPPAYYDKWSIDGFPISDDKKKGVLIYLSGITDDLLREEQVFVVPDDIIKNTMSVINETFSIEIKILRDKKKISKPNKGTETSKILLQSIKESSVDKYVREYVNALVYMPGYKYKKTHKFLLGCCLQKIGKEFAPYKDMEEKNRKDLIIVMRKYSKDRDNVKSGLQMYYPYDEKENVQMNYDESEYFLPRIEKMKEDVIDVDNWLKNMQDKTIIMPIKIINALESNTKKGQEYTNQYLTIFCKTAGVKFENIFDYEMNHNNVIRIICSTLQQYKYDNENEQLMINSAIEIMNGILQDMNILGSIIDDYNRKDIKIIKDLILARCLCLPFDPIDAMKNNNILMSPMETSRGFVLQLSKSIYQNVFTYIRSIQMPSEEDNVNFMNSIREQDKNKKLAFLNNKTQEERDLHAQMKKIGIDYDDDVDNSKEESYIIDDPDDDGVREFERGDEEDMDDEYLD